MPTLDKNHWIIQLLHFHCSQSGLRFVLFKCMAGLRLCTSVLSANVSGKSFTFKERQNKKNCFHDIITLSSLSSILKHAVWPFSWVLNKGWQLVSLTQFILHLSSEAQYNLFLQKNLPLELTNWQGFINNWWDMQAAWCEEEKVAITNNVNCCSLLEVIYIKPVKTTPMTLLPIINRTFILTCMNLHPCCSHTISSPCPFLCLAQSLVADLRMTGDPHTDLEQGQLGHSNFFLSLVEATVASSLMHSPSADPSMKD